MTENEFLHFLVLSLAVFRLSHMITDESGPFWMFRKLRSTVKKKAPKPTHMDEGISCPLCMSMQLAIAVAAIEYFFHENPFFEVPILSLAISGASILFHQLKKTA